MDPLVEDHVGSCGRVGSLGTGGEAAHGDVYLTSRQLRAEPQRLRWSAAHFCELALNADFGWPFVLYLGPATLLGLCGLLAHVQLHGVVFAIIIYNLVHFNL